MGVFVGTPNSNSSFSLFKKKKPGWKVDYHRLPLFSHDKHFSIEKIFGGGESLSPLFSLGKWRCVCASSFISPSVCVDLLSLESRGLKPRRSVLSFRFFFFFLGGNISLPTSSFQRGINIMFLTFFLLFSTFFAKALFFFLCFFFLLLHFLFLYRGTKGFFSSSLCAYGVYLQLLSSSLVHYFRGIFQSLFSIPRPPLLSGTNKQQQQRFFPLFLGLQSFSQLMIRVMMVYVIFFFSFFVAIPSEVLAQLLGRGCLLALFV